VFEWISPEEQQQRVRIILEKADRDSLSDKLIPQQKACT
jgi:hypothetical protein